MTEEPEKPPKIHNQPQLPPPCSAGTRRGSGVPELRGWASQGTGCNHGMPVCRGKECWRGSPSLPKIPPGAERGEKSLAFPLFPSVPPAGSPGSRLMWNMSMQATRLGHRAEHRRTRKGQQIGITEHRIKMAYMSPESTGM